MIFEPGKQYIVEVTANAGWLVLGEYNEEHMVNLDTDDTEILTQHEKDALVNQILTSLSYFEASADMSPTEVLQYCKRIVKAYLSEESESSKHDAHTKVNQSCDSCEKVSQCDSNDSIRKLVSTNGCVSYQSKIDDNHFKVSDEVTCGDDVYKGIITKVLHDSSRVSVMFTTGESMIFPMDDVHKTGKSHPELITILSKLRK